MSDRFDDFDTSLDTGYGAGHDAGFGAGHPAEDVSEEPADHPALRGMEAYWNELRGHRRLPKRRDVDPGKLGEALPSAFLMQRVAPGVGRIRVAGQRLSALLGMEARGMPLTAFFAATARQTVTDHLIRLFDEPAVIELPVSSRRGLGRPRLTGRLMLLPLIGDDGLVSSALGAMVVEGGIGTAPRRFDIAPGPLRCDEVRSSRMAGLHRQILGEPDDAGYGTGHPAGLLSDIDRPYLRLVVDNG